MSDAYMPLELEDEQERIAWLRADRFTRGQARAAFARDSTTHGEFVSTRLRKVWIRTESDDAIRLCERDDTGAVAYWELVE